MPDTPDIEISEARLDDQGKLGDILLRVWKPLLEKELLAAREAGAQTPSADDELMAADDFYFSAIDLMNCCYFARAGDQVVGAAAVNPYVGELQFVAVFPEWRRKGLGRRLVAACLAELRRRAISHVKVDCPAEFAAAGGEAFLRTLGFGEIRRTVRMGRKV